jgi:RNA polymerase sigma-70 factor, ECF subfamily
MSVESFESHRPLLFSIAYRMLGAASDAEDIVQDAYVRYAAARPTALRSERAWLTTVVTRLCLDRLKSARIAREQYVGEWLPEPVLTADATPDAMLQRHESVTLAFLLLLETLTSEERAVFVLKEAFDYSHDEIADILETTTANARQLLHRAKARLAERRPRFGGDPAAKRALAERFVAAIASDNPDAVAAVLAQDVGFWSDGGGKVRAAGRPFFGADAVSRLLLGFFRAARRQGLADRASFEVLDVNAEPALILRESGRLFAVYGFSVDGDRITAIRVVLNPDKLAFIGRQLDAMAGRR